jgi:uncharacterized protein (DUF2461 family)
LQHKEVKKTFQGLSTDAKLARPPKGYDIDNPAIELLKLKSFTAITSLSDKEVLDPAIVKKTLSIFKAIVPLIHFLNRAIE